MRSPHKTGHPDLCPYCRAPISPTQRQRINERPDESRGGRFREDIERMRARAFREDLEKVRAQLRELQGRLPS